MAEGKKATLVKHGASKGFMKAQSNILEKSPVLLYEDFKQALEQISSIIFAEDYEDLGNHSTEAMVESGLFAVTQVIRPITFPSINLILMNIKLPSLSCIFRQ